MGLCVFPQKSGKMSQRTWDPFKTYDVSQTELKAMAERAQIRASLKAEYQKKVTNPHRGVHGYIFDPAVQRYLSMRATHWDQFKVTPKSTFVGFAVGAFPILGFWYLLHQDKKQLEEKCRTGQIAYRDRDWKLV